MAFVFPLFLWLFALVDGFTPQYSTAITQNREFKRCESRLCLRAQSFRHEENCTVPLSDVDTEILNRMKSRIEMLPTIVTSETILLPGQQMTFRSNHRKFNTTANGVETKALAIIGRDPESREMLNFGVKGTIQEISSTNDGFTEICVMADQVFEVIGEPFWDDAESFNFCHVDLCNNHDESVPQGDQLLQAKIMYEKLPILLYEWSENAAFVEYLPQETVDELLDNAGSIPASFRDRAMWAAAMINAETGKFEATREIRPKMLEAKSDFERLQIVSLALQDSIDEMFRVFYKMRKGY